MAYSGSTAASSVANPPRRMIDPIMSMGATTGFTVTPNAPNGQGGGLWYYCSTNTTAEVVGANFFTDGKALGMRPGDVVIGVHFTTAGSSGTVSLGVVTGVSTSGASLSSVLAV